jgi:hypothetical protein
VWLSSANSEVASGIKKSMRGALIFIGYFVLIEAFSSARVQGSARQSLALQNEDAARRGRRSS